MARFAKYRKCDWFGRSAVVASHATQPAAPSNDMRAIQKKQYKNTIQKYNTGRPRRGPSSRLPDPAFRRSDVTMEASAKLAAKRRSPLAATLPLTGRGGRRSGLGDFAAQSSEGVAASRPWQHGPSEFNPKTRRATNAGGIRSCRKCASSRPASRRPSRPPRRTSCTGRTARGS